MRQFKDRVIETGWLALVAALPLFIAPWGQNIFELPKAILLWMVVVVMGATWLAHRLKPKMHPGSHATPALLALAFGAALAASTLFSTNRLQSAQGSYERMQGALTTLCYLALFLMVADRLRTLAQVERLMAAIAWGSAPVALYGLLQALKLDPLPWVAEGSPVISTLGRSNFVGAYLVLVLPITLACLVQARDRARARYTGLFVTQLACLAATMSRAAWLGAFAAGGVLCLASIWQRGRRRLAIIVACVGFLGLLGGMVALPFIPGLTGSIGARGLIWRTAWPLIAARPILGYGPETFGQVFTTVFPPELVYLQGRAVVVDRAHNLILDTLATTGIVGLLVYALLIGTTLVQSVRTLLQSPDRQTHVIVTAGLAAVIGHLVETQFSFAVTTTATLFWILLGLLTARWNPSASLPANVADDDHRVFWSRRLLAIALLIAVLPASVAILLGDLAAGQAHRTQTVGDVQYSVTAIERALALWPAQPTYHEHLSWLHLQLALRGYNPLAEFQSAEAALDTARRLAPGNYRIWAGYGELYTEWGKAGDPARFAQAESAFRQAVTLFPGSAMLHTGWGVSYMAQNRLVEATAQFHQAAHLDHTDAWAYWRLGDALLAQDDLAGAEEAYHNAIRWVPDLVEPYRGLGHIYHRQGQFEAALLAYQTALSMAQDDPHLYLEVAYCYRDMGQTEFACEAAEHGLWIAPAHPDLLLFHAGCP